MEKTHQFYEKDGLQILAVHNLLYEQENKEILQAAISRLEKGFSNFAVDFSAMPYINSVGLSFLINLMLRVNEFEGKLVLVNANKIIIRLLIVTKVYKMFTLKNSLEDAVQFMQEQ